MTQDELFNRITNLLNEKVLSTYSLEKLEDGGIVLGWVSVDRKQTLNFYVDDDGLTSDFCSLRNGSMECKSMEFRLDVDAAITYIEKTLQEMNDVTA
jgi:hypothetical protein